MLTRERYLQLFPIQSPRFELRPYVATDVVRLAEKIREVSNSVYTASVRGSEHKAAEAIAEMEGRPVAELPMLRLGAFWRATSTLGRDIHEQGELAADVLARASYDKTQPHTWEIWDFTRPKFPQPDVASEVLTQCVMPLLRHKFGAKAFVVTVGDYTNEGFVATLASNGFVGGASHKGQRRLSFT